MKKSRIIPFAVSPKSWGLSGKTRDIAEAHYYMDGEELARRLLEIEYSGTLTPAEKIELKARRVEVDLEYGKITPIEAQRAHAALDFPKKNSTEYKEAMLKIDFHFEEIEEFEYDKGMVELQHKNKESAEYKIALTNVLKKHDQISEREYEKEIATIQGLPWVQMIEAKIKYDPDTGNSFEFELDWNQAFVEDLVNSGWHGASQSEIVDQWFTQTCQDVFNTDPEYFGAEEPPQAATTRRKTDGGKTEFS